VNSKQLNHMMRHPTKWVRFQTTGALPRLIRLDSPLIRLLESIPPRDRLAIRGVRVDQRLGYSGSRLFENAEQALRWIRPEQEVVEGDFHPGETWRIKAFTQPITLSLLLGQAEAFPNDLRDRLRHLDPSRGPASAPLPPASEAEDRPDQQDGNAA